jgi:hypothetical protein
MSQYYYSQAQEQLYKIMRREIMEFEVREYEFNYWHKIMIGLGKKDYQNLKFIYFRL